MGILMKVFAEEVLISDIKKHFADYDFELKSNEVILEPEYHYEDSEHDEIYKFYHNKTWKQALDNREKMFSSDLGFLTHKAVVKFLPAFLLYDLMYPIEADTFRDGISFYIDTIDGLKELISVSLSSEQKKDLDEYLKITS
jgi:hypothetical protein